MSAGTYVVEEEAEARIYESLMLRRQIAKGHGFNVAEVATLARRLTHSCALMSVHERTHAPEGLLSLHLEQEVEELVRAALQATSGIPVPA